MRSAAAAYREQTDRLLGAAVAQCLSFEVPAKAHAHTEGISWVQPNLAGVPAVPLRVHAPPRGRWRLALKRSGPSVSANGTALWTGGRIEDAVLKYTMKNQLEGGEAQVAHSCRVVDALPALGPSGRSDRLPAFPDPERAALGLHAESSQP